VRQRNVIVTGACGGIGRATAAAFGDAGWHVIGVDLVSPDDSPSTAEFIVADLAADDGISELRSALSHISELDALVNNAAIQVNSPLVETSDHDWDRVMNTNVRAAFRMIRSFHPALAAANGAVVNIGSVHSVATSQNVSVYATSKGALAALTRSSALELALDGIRCNAVLPGAVMTPMLEDGLGRRPHPDGPSGNANELIARTPLGFIATPEQIAPTIVHLADNSLSPYTTGQMVIVDGGATARLSTE
jgi:glucose 1-dehydrogenase